MVLSATQQCVSLESVSLGNARCHINHEQQRFLDEFVTSEATRDDSTTLFPRCVNRATLINGTKHTTGRNEQRGVDHYQTSTYSVVVVPPNSTCRKHFATKKEGSCRVRVHRVGLVRPAKGDPDQRTVPALRALAPIDTLRFSIDSLFYNRRDIVKASEYRARRLCAHDAPLNLLNLEADARSILLVVALVRPF